MGSQSLDTHVLKSVRTRGFSELYNPALPVKLQLRTLFLCIKPECGKIQTRKIPNTNKSYAVTIVWSC